MTMQTAARSTSIDGCSHPAALYLVSVDPLKNRYRFYRMHHQRTLWGEDVLVQTWGRLGTNGRTRVHFVGESAELKTQLVKLVRRRVQHGYQVIPTQRACGNPLDILVTAANQ